MTNPLLTDLGDLVVASSHALARMWQRLAGGGPDERVRRPAPAGREDESSSADRTLLDLIVPIATRREAEVQAYWRLVRAELGRGMPADDARPLLTRASEVIGSWQTLAAALARTIAALEKSSGQEYAAPDFPAAVARTEATLDVVRRTLAHMSGTRPAVDEARLDAGRKAVSEGRAAQV